MKPVVEARDMTLPTIVRKMCIVCSSEFLVKRKVIWNGGGKYCGKQCLSKARGIKASLAAQKLRVEKQCKVCNSFIYIKKSHIDIEGTYCSRECMSIDYSNRLKGKSNPNFKNKNSTSKEYQNNNCYLRRIRKQGKFGDGHLDYNDIKQFKDNSKMCYWCNVKFTKNNPIVLDHYIPISKNGDNSIENIVASCRSCNAKKWATSPEEYANKIGRLL